MKKFAFSFLFLCSFYITFSQTPQEVKAPIASVKVCLNAALITHSQKVKVKSGFNKLIFTGLASDINSKHISLRNPGNAELLKLYLVRISDSTEISSLNSDILNVIRKSKDSLLSMEKVITKLKFQSEALMLERDMLIINNNIISNGKQVSLAELKLTTDFYREHYTEVCMELTNKQKEIKQARKNKIRLLKSLFNIENDLDQGMSICIVVAELNNPDTEYTADLELSYLASGSGWIPVYNIYATNNSTVKIEYRAKVLNNTGIDWNNMKVSLSTADPFQYYAAPDLDPFYISDEYEDEKEENKAKPLNTANVVEEEEIYIPDREISFAISKRYSFNTGFTPYLIDVTVYDNLSPSFLYRCAPKKEDQVYAIAKIKDWEKLDLLDGEANIYNDNILLGKSYIRPSEIEEDLELPLGVVKDIYVKHKLVSEYSSKKVLGGNVESTQSYEIKLKNNSGQKVIVEVIDQIPVSEDSDVKTSGVEMTEGGEKDNVTGKISWKQELNPSSEQAIDLKYSVTYPKRRGYSSFYRYKKRAIRAKF
jgi:hypothetical protein